MPCRATWISGWLVAILIGVVLDLLVTGLRFSYIPFEPALVWQTPVLWLAVGSLPLLGVWAVSMIVTRLFTKPLPEELGWCLGALAGFAPVSLHALLARHVGLEGDLTAFASARPWLELTVFAVFAVLLWRVVTKLELPVIRRHAWRASVALFAGVTGVALLSAASARRSELEAGSDSSGPNVLLLVWDTCRADRLSTASYDRDTTPGLAEFAESAQVFEEARSVASFTFTSHASLLTGTYPSTHGARLMSSRLDPRRAASVATEFQAAGYRTGAFVGTDVLNGRTGIRSGFERYDDRVDPAVTSTFAWGLVNDLQVVLARAVPAFRNNGQPHGLQDFQRPAGDVLARALDWIQADDTRPWFAFVNLYDVHWPYLPKGAGRDLVRAYDGPLDGYTFRSDSYPAGYVPNDVDAQHVSDLYDGELLELDRVVDSFLAKLDLARGDTAVLLTSDHGEAFGEGGRWKHDDILEPQVRVPLLVREAAMAPEGRRVGGLVSGVDVAPTLLGLAGLSVPLAMEGIDLSASSPDPDRAIRVEDRDHSDPNDVRRATYRGWWKLVELGVDRSEVRLYDLRSDPIGVIDVSERYPEVTRSLIQLAAKVPDERCLESNGPQTTTDALRALGYVGS